MGEDLTRDGVPSLSPPLKLGGRVLGIPVEVVIGYE
jgi:hypothetical protein